MMMLEFLKDFDAEKWLLDVEFWAIIPILLGSHLEVSSHMRELLSENIFGVGI